MNVQITIREIVSLLMLCVMLNFSKIEHIMIVGFYMLFLMLDAININISDKK